ncbi:MAG: ATPase P [Chitinophagaceae bacterium BSSC1]|nr:MAG: ATPase P [Chitinophagaceae bacterium BSSC1]
MEKVNWKVEGMSCTNCALTVNKYLTGKGMQAVQINFMGGDLSFDLSEGTDKKELAKGIEGLGYHVITGEETDEKKPRKLFQNHFQRFLFCIIFTAPLLLHMIPGVHIHFLMNPYVQLGLTIPVFIVGMDFFGRSAWHSLLKGIPNMNVLIAIGAIAAFGYSLYGTIIGDAEHFMFYETAATILTLVFLGNWMEDKSVETTQTALKKLVVSKKQMANMIAYDDQHQEHIFPVETGNLKVGDLVLIGNGEAVPMDCKVLWGEASVDESIITGESTPVEKKMHDTLIGGSVVSTGTLKAYITAVGENTVLANILKLVKAAQTEKPPIQQLADRISAVFVPTVISLAVLTIIGNYFIGHLPFSESLLRGIAVLVISCPCAMGLATPAAIAVGLGRAARNGVLFKNAKSLEVFKQIKQVVFDKTGTLTTGQFSVAAFKAFENIAENDETQFKRIAFSLEKYSNHPIAKSISKAWKVKDDLRWAKVEEIRGLGMRAIDKLGNEFQAVSFKGISETYHDHSHNVYITKNGELLGWIDVVDEIRPEAAEVIEQLRAAGIRTILLSGDGKAKCEQVANTLHIDEWLAEQSPEQKLAAIANFNQHEPTAMVGDGINDAPALAKATVGISLSDASHIAMQSAQVVLMNHGLKNLPLALGLGKHTYTTIQQNLFWAFIYNIVAIPVAALGYLSPGFGALVMGLSDVVLAINSIRLNYKKVV